MSGDRFALPAAWRLGLLACLTWTPLVQGCSSMMTSIGGGVTPELKATGVAALAEILEIWDTGWTINDNPVIGMRVLVRPPDRPDFEATIEKTTVSRIALAQFQPGAVVPVRFDPRNPALVAVDPDADPSAESAPSSGNPYRDRYERAQVEGAALLPPPATPEVFLGTGDMTTDFQTLFENDYILLGGSGVRNATDPAQALEQGREIGAALVVLYGHFEPAGGRALDILPFSRRTTAGGTPHSTGTVPSRRFVTGQVGPGDQFATYWGKTRPPILGLVSRPLEAREQARLRVENGIVVETVTNGSPAGAAGIVPGDIIVAFDGRTFTDPREVPGIVSSLAGREVSIDLIRAGQRLSVTVRLNPATP